MPEEGNRVKIHIVQKGDTLWKIAQKYGVDFEALKKMNAQLSNPEMIMPGMKIKVPEVGGVHKGTPHVHHGGHKEVPKVHHKEVPKVHHKEVPKPVIKKEQPKEHPHAIYQPVLPQAQALSEIDINNYYMMNMSQLQTQVQQPLPPTPPPVVIQEEIVESFESPCEEVAGQYVPPVYPNYCYPAAPVMPYCDPCYPYPQQHVPMPIQQWVPQPQVQGMMMQPQQQWIPPQQQWVPQMQGPMIQPRQPLPAALPGMQNISMPETSQQWDEESSGFPQMGQNPSYGQMQQANYGTMAVPQYQQAMMPAGYPAMPQMPGDYGAGSPQAYPYRGQYAPVPQQMYPYGAAPVMPESAGTYAMPQQTQYGEDDE